MTDAETLSEGVLLAIADEIPKTVNLLDDLAVADCLARKVCPQLGLSVISVEPHMDTIKSIALARRLGAFA
jgi:hypothetical protein